jgi:hypothetical protein
MHSKSSKLLPAVYQQAIERAVVDCFDLDDADEVLCSSYFRSEVIAVESDNELHDDDKLEDDEYALQAIWFLAGWTARQNYHNEKRLEAQIEEIIKTVS